MAKQQGTPSSSDGGWLIVLIGLAVIVGLIIFIMKYIWPIMGVSTFIASLFAARAIQRANRKKQSEYDQYCAETAARADQQEDWVEQGDARGIYGPNAAELMEYIRSDDPAAKTAGNPGLDSATTPTQQQPGTPQRRVGPFGTRFTPREERATRPSGSETEQPPSALPDTVPVIPPRSPRPIPTPPSRARRAAVLAVVALGVAVAILLAQIDGPGSDRGKGTPTSTSVPTRSLRTAQLPTTEIPPPIPNPEPSPSYPPRPTHEPSPTYDPPGRDYPYNSCAEARADGRHDIPSNDPAYNPKLDRDHDGIACES